MRRLIAVALSLMFGVPVPVPVSAQPAGCYFTDVSTSGMTADFLPVYDDSMRPAGRLPRAQVPARWRMIDCGDPVFLAVSMDRDIRLVRRSALMPPDAPATACMCPSPARPGAGVLGVPGAGKLPICPESVRRCPRQ